MAVVQAESVTFLWEGRDKRGVKLKGQQVAANPSLVRAELRRQGINPIRVRKKPKPLFGGAGHRIRPKDIAVFSRQLATMLKAGVPLVTAFQIIAGGVKNPRMRNMVNRIRSDVESGGSLFEALSAHPGQFDELYVNLVKAGESAGVLDTVLDEIASYKERIESIKGKIKKALYYPAAVIAVAIIVSAILLIYVIPQFEGIFANFGADLPAFTQAVVSVSRWLRSNGFGLLIGLIVVISSLVTLKKRSRPFAHWLDRVSLKLPIVGAILEKAAIARFCRTLAITFAAGVPLVDALKIVSGATGNQVYNDAAARVREDVAVGHQLQLAMQQTDVFPNMVIQMAAIGEESGSLDHMLIKVAEAYEEEVNNAVDALSSLLEPAIIVFVGVVVGTMVIAMYLPIFKMAAVI
ncbi:MAG: type II secretion system F family protein [Xanthomonadales bacterium]|nr:type II secretion system F family protein [Xanthomonadales bacterium]NIN59731.1 type II secretion system F family protein [Xanthomonadales bacterium]NIN75500.1 type II secretion system F family protein [Xanthomonadales bacterium]NIO15189.1 type II secretion system F family protein [Xanthomonadales bacterium]NIP12124.1 type II secretion system F family protein [Xanthomonadales bacterium]